MTYLKRPIDPIIWKVLEELLDKTKKTPEEMERLKCEPDELQQKLSQSEDFEEIEANAPESLFVDPKDFQDELEKAKEKGKDEKFTQFVRFGITEFIPYIETQLFGRDKGDGAEEGKEDLNKLKKKKPSILRLSKAGIKEPKGSEKKVSLQKESIPNQRKETDLAAKLDKKRSSKDSKKTKNEVSSTGKERKGSNQTDKNEAEEEASNNMPASNQKKTVEENKESADQAKQTSVKTEEEKTNPDIPVADSNKDSESKKTVDTKSAKELSKSSKDSKSKDKKEKDSKSKDKKGKDKGSKGKAQSKKKDKKPKEIDCSSFMAQRTVENEKGDHGNASEGKELDAKIKFKDLSDNTPKNMTKNENKYIANMSIMKQHASSPSSSANKLDLNVKFISKKYVEPHILKSLDISKLQNTKERPPTPHPSYIELFASDLKRSLDEKAEDKENLLKFKECKGFDSDSSQIPNQQTSSPQQSGKTSLTKKSDDTSVKQAVQPASEIVMNEIQADIAEPVEAESSIPEKSMTSIESAVRHLEKFISSKLPHKYMVTEKQEVDDESVSDNVPVPPIINKSLLSRRRIIKRPLANILRKIYGWVMTTVIRRRLLISYGLPPKIRKECFYNKKFDPNDIDLSRGLAKLILEEPSECYPFALLEPYIETILEQTMDPSKRYNFTKRVIRMENPLTEDSLESLKKFLFQSEQDSFFKKSRTRRLKKFCVCLKMKVDSVINYHTVWGGRQFDPYEWLDIFETPKLEDLSYICSKRKRNIAATLKSQEQQKNTFVSYGGESPTMSRRSSTSSASLQEQKKTEKKMERAISLRKSTRKSFRESMWMKANVQKDPYEEWKPGFSEKNVSSRQKMLEIVINKVADVTPSITNITDEMRRDFGYHKNGRRWMEKERQLRFISHLNMFCPIQAPKGKDRKLMKFVQSKTYPYFGTFLECQTFAERHKSDVGLHNAEPKK